MNKVNALDATRFQKKGISRIFFRINDRMMTYAHFIKLSHTIFSLPFALVALVVGQQYHRRSVSLDIIIGVILCLSCLRASAMIYNRLKDRDIDALNPRTQHRELVSGKITVHEAQTLLVVTTLAYLGFSFYIDLPWPITLIFLFTTWSYSHAKRFTWGSHYWLGLALAGAPLGTWLVVTHTIDAAALVLSMAVMFWVAGFDILYSLQDIEFDAKHGLHSIPTRFGSRNALLISRASHIITIFLLIFFGMLTKLNWLYFMGTFIFATGIAHEHSIVKENDLSRINQAFFTTNGILSVMFFMFSWASVLLFYF